MSTELMSVCYVGFGSLAEASVHRLASCFGGGCVKPSLGMILLDGFANHILGMVKWTGPAYAAQWRFNDFFLSFI